MRLAALLALAAPALAAAQAAGEVTFDDAVVNAAECAPGATTTVILTWNPAFQTDKSLVPGVYKVLASNTKPPDTGDRFCPADAPTAATPVHTAQVGANVTANVSAPQSATLNTADFVEAAGLEACSVTTDTPIYVCVEFQPYKSGSTTELLDRTGWAVGKLTLTLSKPAKPVITDVKFGDGALNVFIDEGTGGAADTVAYRVVATTTDPADPEPTHDTGRVTASDGEIRIDGLVNGVTYTVEVYAISGAGNESEKSAPAEGTPDGVMNFFELYRSKGGVEQGGCGTGSAGTLALAAVAALLALARRRA